MLFFFVKFWNFQKQIFFNFSKKTFLFEITQINNERYAFYFVNNVYFTLLFFFFLGGAGRGARDFENARARIYARYVLRCVCSARAEKKCARAHL